MRYIKTYENEINLLSEKPMVGDYVIIKSTNPRMPEYPILDEFVMNLTKKVAENYNL